VLEPIILAEVIDSFAQIDGPGTIVVAMSLVDVTGKLTLVRGDLALIKNKPVLIKEAIPV
jgi:hypothetical protein